MIGAVRSRVPPDEVLEMFDEAVGAFVAEAGRRGRLGAGPPAATWTGTELARHVLSVIGWYHDWLDRAEAGDSSPAFPIDDLAARNARDLADLAQHGGLSGPEATHGSACGRSATPNGSRTPGTCPSATRGAR